MINRQEFPYLQELVINDAYAVKNLRVPVFQPGQEFKHLVLTGRNGSGKTTVLRGLNAIISQESKPKPIGLQLEPWSASVDYLSKTKAFFYRLNAIHYSINEFLAIANQVIFAFLEATRKVQVKDVASVMREDALEAQLKQSQPNQSPVEFFKQYLVNKKVFQVFDAMDGKAEGAKQQEQFFSKLEETLAAAHKANMMRPHRWLADGLLDPCRDKVETRLLATIGLNGSEPRFEAADTTDVAACNTASLLNQLHNGQPGDDISRLNTKHLRVTIREQHSRVMHAILHFQRAEKAGNPQQLANARRTLRGLLSRQAPFTQLMRAMYAVQEFVPADLLD